MSVSSTLENNKKCKANMKKIAKLLDHIIDVANEFDVERHFMIREIENLSKSLDVESKWKIQPLVGDNEVVFELKNLKRLLKDLTNE